MKKTLRKKLVCMLMMAALLLSAAITYAQPASADNLNADEVNRFNVILVIDGSGSLVSGSSATDKSGLRYDAINLFLALLTNDGNQVGAIVFDDDSNNYLLNTGLTPVSGKGDKVSLGEKIRSAGTRNDTDIGSALLSAVSILEASGSQDGRSPAVVLFSDGRTDLGGNKEAYEQSLENRETAITKAQDAGIPIYSICLNASPVADPQELSEIASRTSGGFVSVSRAEDLAGAFETFYQLIFNSSGSEKRDVPFGADGKLTYSFDVPSVGAEEVNIILKQAGLQSIQVSGPSRQISAAELEENTMTGGDYEVIKLVKPQVGQWNLELSGTPGSRVTVNVVYNADSVAELVTANGKSEYNTGESVTFQAYLKKDGSRVTDSSVLGEYKAVLHLSNLTDGTTQDIDMTPDADGMFVYEFRTNYYIRQSAPQDIPEYKLEDFVVNGQLNAGDLQREKRRLQDLLAGMYDPANGGRQVALKNDGAVSAGTACVDRVRKDYFMHYPMLQRIVRQELEKQEKIRRAMEQLDQIEEEFTQYKADMTTFTNMVFYGMIECLSATGEPEYDRISRAFYKYRDRRGMETEKILVEDSKAFRFGKKYPLYEMFRSYRAMEPDEEPRQEMDEREAELRKQTRGANDHLIAAALEKRWNAKALQQLVRDTANEKDEDKAEIRRFYEELVSRILGYKDVFTDEQWTRTSKVASNPTPAASAQQAPARTWTVSPGGSTIYTVYSDRSLQMAWDAVNNTWVPLTAGMWVLNKAGDGWETIQLDAAGNITNG